MGEGTTPWKWWRRAVAAAKDKRSLCLARLGPLSPARRHRPLRNTRHCPQLEAAVIKSTSHDETRMDYKNAARVLAWARSSPATSLRPLMWLLARRVDKTRRWAVALKALMITHGVLLCSGEASAAAASVGRLPFDLSAFRDRSSWALSAFVRAYFGFLDQRSSVEFLLDGDDTAGEDDRTEEEAQALRKVERKQDLLELLMQVRPYGDLQGVAKYRLMLEAMDCVVVDILDVYSAVCGAVAHSLLAIFAPCFSDEVPAAFSSTSSSDSAASSGGFGRCNREWGAVGIRVLRRAAEQSRQLSSYFELCRELGVQNAADLPPVQRISDEDVDDLEALLLLGRGGVPPGTPGEEQAGNGSGRGGGSAAGGGGGDGVKRPAVAAAGEEAEKTGARTVVTEDWVVFEDCDRGGGAASCGDGAADALAVGSKNGLWEPTLYHEPGPMGRPLRSRKEMWAGGAHGGALQSWALPHMTA